MVGADEPGGGWQKVSSEKIARGMGMLACKPCSHCKEFGFLFIC